MPRYWQNGPDSEGRQAVQVEVHVIRDVEIEFAVVVVVAECGAGAPAASIVDACFGGDIGEAAVMIIVVENPPFR